MNRVLRGVVRGRTIEITEDLGRLDGQAVELIVIRSAPIDSHPPEGIQPRTLPKKLPGPPSGWRLGGSATPAGLLAEEWTEEDDRILEQIHMDRKAANWRELPE